MRILYIAIFFVLGTLMGSFFTVIGLRLPKHEDFIKNHSYCDECKHKLSLLDMIPILSFFFLKKKCRYCHKSIDSLSTYMEFFTGVLFALAYFVFGFSYELFIALGIIALLVILSVSDVTYLIIPDEILIFFSGFFLILITLKSGVVVALFSILSGIIMFLIMYAIMLIGNFIFKKESLGGGDIKLMFVIGLILNPFLGLIVVFIASFIALPVSFIILLKRGQKLVPFGPFLLIAFMFIYFTKLDMRMILDFIRSI